MGRLIYAANVSVDGFVEDENGSLDWSVPVEAMHAFWNEHERRVGTSLYGRRMYETMSVWERDDWLAGVPQVVQDYAGIWRDTDKVVFSSTLADVTTSRTTLERTFDPESIGRLKEASPSDLSIGGPALAAAAFRSGLVDECLFVVCPVVLGGGKPALAAHVRLDLTLIGHGRIGEGMVYLRYAVRPRP